MGSWTLRKMLFHMTVLDLVPEKAEAVLISPPAIGTAFVPRLRLNKVSNEIQLDLQFC